MDKLKAMAKALGTGISNQWDKGRPFREMMGAALTGNFSDVGNIAKDYAATVTPQGLEDGIMNAGMGFAPIGMVGKIKPMLNIRTEQQLADAISKGEGQFIRWSRGPVLDKKRGGSRDFVSGSEHGAFSAVPINPKWATDPVWMSRRVGEYGFLRMKDPKITPYIYSGKKVGIDSDGYDLISDISGIAKISPELMDKMSKLYEK